MNEYMIVNKTDILKRIEELEDRINDTRFKEIDHYKGQITSLKRILAQSTPLIPEIEKAFDVGNKRGWSGYPNTDNWTQPTKQDYISNLKLDI